MQALVLENPSELVVRAVETPQPGPEDLLIQVRACGICGSDVHGYDGSTGRRIPPLIMGHEAAGVVAATGAAVRGFAVGDRVTFDSTISCGTCSYCARGAVNLCERRQVLGVSCGDYRRHGAFAEYVAVPQHIAYKLPEGFSFERAALIEAVSVAVHAAKLTPIVDGDTVLVIGAGMIGLLALQAFRHFGCRRVFVVDLEADRLQQARAMGADATFQAQDANLQEALAAAAGSGGIDIAVDAVGNESSVASAIAHVRRGGTVTLIGNLAPKVELPLQAVVTRQLRLQGSCASAGEYPECIRLMESGAIQVDSLISAVAPLAEGAQWFTRLAARERGLMKVILRP